MKITLSQFAGFCDGVHSAYDIVSSLDMTKAKKPVFVLGSLVHNSDVVGKIEEKGIEKTNFTSLMKSQPGEIGTLIITAHGAGPKVYEIAKEKNIDLIDTTCPKVIKAQRLAQLFTRRMYVVILVGDKNHKEVKSIFEWGKKTPIVVSNENDLHAIDLSKAGKIMILSQTTQRKEVVDSIYKFIKGKYANVEKIDTICLATEQRQNEIREISKKNEAVVVIGSPESANSTRLFEIAKKINKKSIFIERASALHEDFFKNVESVAVTAGASTPSWIIEEVMSKLEEF
jgi:4-hydroxy-3-methylbut-2-enyl diphosphate reductase